MTSETKHRIPQTASQLFFKEGFATGIDRVISECGVAKMTLYSHFKTKEGLILAILNDVQRSLQEEIRRETTHDARSASDQLDVASLILCAGMNDPELRVGLSVRTLVEFSSPKNAVHEAARRFDLTNLKWLELFCKGARLPDARKAAREILHIAKGCFLMDPTVTEVGEVIALSLLRPILAQAAGETNPTCGAATPRSKGHSPSPRSLRL
jgi:AcrR family transcriptional regulator